MVVLRDISLAVDQSLDECGCGSCGDGDGEVDGGQEDQVVRGWPRVLSAEGQDGEDLACCAEDDDGRT